MGIILVGSQWTNGKWQEMIITYSINGIITIRVFRNLVVHLKTLQPSLARLPEQPPAGLLADSDHGWRPALVPLWFLSCLFGLILLGLKGKKNNSKNTSRSVKLLLRFHFSYYFSLEATRKTILKGFLFNKNRSSLCGKSWPFVYLLSPAPIWLILFFCAGACFQSAGERQHHLNEQKMLGSSRECNSIMP